MDSTSKSVIPSFVKAMFTPFVSQAPPFSQTWNQYWIYYVPLWLVPVLFSLSPEKWYHVILMGLPIPIVLAKLPYYRHKVPYTHTMFFGGLVTFTLLIASIFVAKYLHVHYGMFNDKFVR